MNIAFAGFRHAHIYALYRWAEQEKGLKIIGAWEEDETDRVTAEREVNACFKYHTYEELLQDEEVDIIAVGNYFSARGQMIIAGLQHGKHVISDKPICTSLEELDEIERLVQKTGLKVGCMLDLRYRAASVLAKEAVSFGEIGPVHAVYFGGQHCLNYGTRPMWYFEAGKQGGTINDIAVHGIDLAEYIMDTRMKQVVSARCWNGFAKEVPDFKDCAQFMAEFENGAGLIADVSYASPKNCGVTPKQYWRFTFWGEKGIMEFDYIDNVLELTLSGENRVIKRKGKDSRSNPLHDFLCEINGVQTDLNTQAVLASARSVLRVQAQADR